MRRRLLCFLLAAALLCAPVLAAPGGAGDPLITRSYIADSFLPRLRQAFESLIRNALGAQPGMVVLTLGAGQSLKLTEGQQLSLMSGALRLSVNGGELADVAAGTALSGTVDAEIGRRYIACERATVWADASEEALVKVSFPVEVGDGCPFQDVQRTDWFYADVSQAYRRGLVNGMSAHSYAPTGTLTGAQCVKLAACMHQLWKEGSVSLSNSSAGPWYRSYVDYALREGILSRELADYDAVIARTDYVLLFYQALPATAYTAVNSIPDGAIPDVAPGDRGAAEIYTFYRAGILTGYAADARHAANAFDPEGSISRAEVATIMNRMFEPEARKQFSIG